MIVMHPDGSTKTITEREHGPVLQASLLLVKWRKKNRWILQCRGIYRWIVGIEMIFLCSLLLLFEVCSLYRE